MSSKILQHGAVGFQEAHRTDKGLVRKNNEDSLILSLENGLYGVCDGMGGHAAGEIASRLASKALSEVLSEFSRNPCDSLQKGIELANDRIFKAQAEKPEYRGMGTTISLLWVSPCGDSRCWIAHVGDSRVYRCSPRGVFQQLTSDHSPVFRLFQQGMLSKDQMRQHPHKNLLERSLGVLPTVEPDIFETRVAEGEIFLICSDGLTDELSDREIKEILSEGSIEEQAERLMAQAKTTGGRDNISLVILQVVGIES